MPQPQPLTIEDPATLTYADRHEGAHYAAIHRTDEVQAGIYVLDPGGSIPAHRHTASWDIAVVLEGEIEVSIDEGGAERTVRLRAQGVNLVPPGVRHSLHNPSAAAPARFLLLQSPSKGFDFRRATG
jgi:quercetin dioxygenase-like cupin family protein